MSVQKRTISSEEKVGWHRYTIAGVSRRSSLALVSLLFIACGGRAVGSPETGGGDEGDGVGGAGGNTGSAPGTAGATSGGPGGSAGSGGSGGCGGAGGYGGETTTTGGGGSSGTTTTTGGGGSGTTTTTTTGAGGGTTTTTGGGGAAGSGGSGSTTTGSSGSSGTAGSSSGGAAGSAGGGMAGSGSGGTAGSGTGGTGSGGGAVCDYCTRRPGPGVSLQCAAGVDESATALLGPAGGTLSLVGQQGNGVAFRLTVPPKAFDGEIVVSVTETSIPPPVEFVDWSPIYEVLPAEMKTLALVTVRLPWANRGGNWPALTVYYAKDRNSAFAPLTDVRNNAGFIDASTTKFGLFFVGVPKTPAQSSCP